MNEGLLRDFEIALHDLCQPLTALQCRLEFGAMCGDPASLAEAVEGGLTETARMFASIAAIRERLVSGRKD